MQYTLTSANNREALSITGDNGAPVAVATGHPNFEKIKRYVLDGGSDWNVVKDLAHGVAQRIAADMSRLSERVGLLGNRLAFDGDLIDTALSRHIVRLVQTGEDYRSAVAFMENLSANPSPLSRRHLWKWLQARDFTLTHDGMVVGYKGVQNTPDNRSIAAGSNRVYVNDVEHTGRIPNPIGATVSIARSAVDPDRDQTCSAGLHVGTHDYATQWAGTGGQVLTVLVNPRDVVAVPRDHEDQKMRVCRYVVQEVNRGRYLDAVVAFDADDDQDLYDEEDAANAA